MSRGSQQVIWCGDLGRVLTDMRKPRKGKTLPGLVILAVLCLIGIMVFIQQFQFIPAATAQSALEAGSEQTSLGEPLTLFPLPETFSVMTPLEHFSPSTLFEKINGQADFYLGSGFVELKSQRYVQTDNQDMWFEVFKYNMGTVENAFSVYSQQYRHNGRPLDWAQFAYAVSNAIFFVHGQDYIEMRAASTSEALNTSMQAMAKEYVASNAVDDATPAGFSWLPRKDLDVKSVTMVVSTAFGFERLDQVFTGEYRIDDITVTAYISERASVEEAAELASSFSSFLLRFGGKELETAFPSPDGRIIEIMDSFNIVFSKGAFLAGVHEARTIEVARELASRLHKQIGVMSGGQNTGN